MEKEIRRKEKVVKKFWSQERMASDVGLRTSVKVMLSDPTGGKERKSKEQKLDGG